MKIENTNYVQYLIEFSKEGRRRAFLDLCEINLKNVFTIAYRLLADFETTKKITLKTFLSVWDNIKNYDSKNSFALWIKNLTIGYSINELRHSEVPKSNPKEPCECNSESEYLELQIKSLPVDDRIIFVLHDLEGYSYQEINNFFNKYEIDEIKTKLITTRDYLMSKIDL